MSTSFLNVLPQGPLRDWIMSTGHVQMRQGSGELFWHTWFNAASVPKLPSYTRSVSFATCFARAYFGEFFLHSFQLSGMWSSFTPEQWRTSIWVTSMWTLAKLQALNENTYIAPNLGAHERLFFGASPAKIYIYIIASEENLRYFRQI